MTDRCSPRMEPSLLPCPFCGGQAVYDQGTEEFFGYDRCVCLVCDAQTVWTESSKDRKISEWNTRAPALPSASGDVAEIVRDLREWVDAVRSPNNGELSLNQIAIINGECMDSCMERAALALERSSADSARWEERATIEASRCKKTERDLDLIVQNFVAAEARLAEAVEVERRLIDWTYLYATEGHGGWPDYQTISRHLIDVAHQRPPEQADAKRFKAGEPLRRVVESGLTRDASPHSVESGGAKPSGGE